jgi:hypothetical protein
LPVSRRTSSLTCPATQSVSVGRAIHRTKRVVFAREK